MSGKHEHVVTKLENLVVEGAKQLTGKLLGLVGQVRSTDTLYEEGVASEERDVFDEERGRTHRVAGSPQGADSQDM